MTDLTALIQRGLEIESEAEAITYFKQLDAQHPDNALVQFELGGAYDSAGHEAQAIPHYRRAIELGLHEEYEPRVAIQLGSSLRNVGEYAEAVAVLTAACQKFPHH